MEPQLIDVAGVGGHREVEVRVPAGAIDPPCVHTRHAVLARPAFERERRHHASAKIGSNRHRFIDRLLAHVSPVPSTILHGCAVCKREVGGPEPRLLRKASGVLYGGGDASIEELDPGETFQSRADLSDWFAFDEASTYRILDSFHLRVVASADDALDVWDDHATGRFGVVVRE